MHLTLLLDENKQSPVILSGAMEQGGLGKRYLRSFDAAPSSACAPRTLRPRFETRCKYADEEEEDEDPRERYPYGVWRDEDNPHFFNAFCPARLDTNPIIDWVSATRIGSFRSEDEAVLVYDAAAQKLNLTARKGEVLLPLNSAQPAKSSASKMPPLSTAPPPTSATDDSLLLKGLELVAERGHRDAAAMKRHNQERQEAISTQAEADVAGSAAKEAQALWEAQRSTWCDADAAAAAAEAADDKAQAAADTARETARKAHKAARFAQQAAVDAGEAAKGKAAVAASADAMRLRQSSHWSAAAIAAKESEAEAAAEAAQKLAASREQARALIHQAAAVRSEPPSM